jgi:hypothetical protein
MQVSRYHADAINQLEKYQDIDRMLKLERQRRRRRPYTNRATPQAATSASSLS